jgi:hypothetical protein
MVLRLHALLDDFYAVNPTPIFGSFLGNDFVLLIDIDYVYETFFVSCIQLLFK